MHSPRRRSAAEQRAGHRSRGDAALRQTLRATANGLLYPSEADASFTWFRRAMPAGGLSATAVRRFARAPAGTKVTETSLSALFRRVIEEADPADEVARALRPRFVALKRALAGGLRDVRVFRVGTGRVKIYVAGITPSGAVAGLRTEALET